MPDTYTIAVLPGDGIGPDVTAQARRALQAIANKYGHDFKIEEGFAGGIAIEETGQPFPDETAELCKRADAILLGAVGGPQWDGLAPEKRPGRALFILRKGYDLFANLRPVTAHRALAENSPLRPELLNGVDILIVRELTGGIYFGERHEAGADGDTASDQMVYSAGEVERVARVAFEAARGRRNKVTSVDKSNVLATSRLWRRVVIEVASDYPDVELEHLLVDACAMHLLRRPADFDVLVTGNMFGDILSDEASTLAGSLGMLPSASLGSGTKGLYEPIHGTAPDIAGQGIANPTGALLSSAMLLRHSFGLEEEASALEEALRQTLDDGHRTADIVKSGETALSTDAFGDEVIKRMEAI